MKKSFAPAALLITLCILLTGCSKGESADGTLKIKEIYGTYEGSGSATKFEVERNQADIKNQRYLFITGDEREVQGEFDSLVITFEEDDEDTIWYQNKHTGSNGELVYNSDTGQWEHKADYPLGTVSTAVTFTKDADGIHATFVFTQSFEREHFENPEPSDGVNEFTLNLTKTK